MSPRTWWRRWRAAHDHHTEARAHLQRLDAQRDEVEQLEAEAVRQLRRNHFSEMVAVAIARRTEGGA